jgi:copper homeostasis protein CutC
MMMEQILECLLAEMNVMQERTDTSLKEIKAEIKTNQEEMMVRLESKIEANNEKFEVLPGSPISQTDIHQARTEFTQEEMKAKMDIHQEKMEAAIHSIQSELVTIKHQVEDILMRVNQRHRASTRN